MSTKQPRATSILFEAVIVGFVFAGLLGFSAFLVYSKSLNAMDEEIKIGLLSVIPPKISGVQK
ncbi:MAG: hypothetical protein ACI9HB_000787 [Gammaproteobacteria bacterium]|jgi:hypothetical protein